MPLYEYLCDACGHRFEIIQRFSDAAPDVCPSCGKGPVVRQMSSPAIQFKGTGWYITDYAQKGKTGGGKNEGAKGDVATDSGKKTEGAKTDGAKADGGQTDAAAKSDAPAKTSTPSTSKSD